MIRITPGPVSVRPAAPSCLEAQRLFRGKKFAAAAAAFQRILQRQPHNVEIYCHFALSSIRAVPLTKLSAQQIRRMLIAVRRLEARIRAIQFFNAPDNHNITEDAIKNRARHIYATFSGMDYNNREKVFDSFAHAQAAAHPERNNALSTEVIRTIKLEVAYYTSEKEPPAPASSPVPPPDFTPIPSGTTPSPSPSPSPPPPPLSYSPPQPTPAPKVRPAPPPISGKEQARLNKAAQKIVIELDKMGLRRRITADAEISSVIVDKIRDGEFTVTPDLLEQLKIVLAKVKIGDRQFLKAPAPARLSVLVAPSAPSALFPTTGNEAQQLLRKLGKAGMDELAVAQATGLSVPLLVRIRRGEIDPSPEILEKLRRVKI